MNMNVNMKFDNSRLVFATVLLGALFLFSGFSWPGVFHSSAASSTAPMNNVQIFVETTTTNLSSYSLTVYNSSGYSVLSETSNYPAFAAELPSGTFLFTVSAMQQNNYYYPVYASGVATASAVSNSSSSSAKMMVPYKEPVVEYGYVEQQVSGQMTLNITTTPLDAVSTSNLVVRVYFANGTAASGVSVQASLVGESYYYGWNSNTVMWNQTGPDGSATLVLPNLPIEVSAWAWIPINLPKNETTVQTTVAGEPVNVTVYWSPTYVGLAGDALMIPPFKASQSITLHAQTQPQYWVMPYGTQTMSGAAYPQETLANNAGGVPASVYSQYAASRSANNQQQQMGGQPQISPLNGETATTTQTTTRTITSTNVTSEGGNVVELLSAAIAVALILSAVGMVLALRRK